MLINDTPTPSYNTRGQVRRAEGKETHNKLQLRRTFEEKYNVVAWNGKSFVPHHVFQ